MYLTHYGLTAKPFALTPDPAFLYPSRQHAMALTMLEYGLESQAAFSLLTGDIGSGKTTLVRKIIRDQGGRAAIGLISHTHARFDSVHAWVVSALEVAPADDSPVAQYEAIVDCCVREYARGRRTLLIIDEAQNLSIGVLEELRLLSNINSEMDLVLQILLVGQPELRATLSSPSLRQLAQRFSVDFHLRSLDRAETSGYVRHRMAAAGCSRQLFSEEAVDLVYARSLGVPRLINHLCDLALVYGYAERCTSIDSVLMQEVVRDRTNESALPIFVAPEPEHQLRREHGKRSLNGRGPRRSPGAAG
jgi:type II secretory pathway predicted ATPase ExeA